MLKERNLRMSFEMKNEYKSKVFKIKNSQKSKAIFLETFLIYQISIIFRTKFIQISIVR